MSSVSIYNGVIGFFARSGAEYDLCRVRIAVALALWAAASARSAACVEHILQRCRAGVIAAGLGVTAIGTAGDGDVDEGAGERRGLGDAVGKGETPDAEDRDGFPGGARSSVGSLDGLG